MCEKTDTAQTIIPIQPVSKMLISSKERGREHKCYLTSLALDYFEQVLKEELRRHEAEKGDVKKMEEK